MENIEKIRVQIRKLQWIAEVLINAEEVPDLDILEHFKNEGKMRHEEAKFYVDQRPKMMSGAQTWAALDLYETPVEVVTRHGALNLIQ